MMQYVQSYMPDTPNWNDACIRYINILLRIILPVIDANCTSIIYRVCHEMPTDETAYSKF
jgi:hypothetical protein